METQVGVTEGLVGKSMAGMSHQELWPLITPISTRSFVQAVGKPWPWWEHKEHLHTDTCTGNCDGIRQIWCSSSLSAFFG